VRALREAHFSVYVQAICISRFYHGSLHWIIPTKTDALCTRGIEWSLRALAGMRAVRLFLRARAVIKYVLRAASTLKNTDGEQQALRKFSRWNLDFSLLERTVLRPAIWLTPLNQ